MSQTLYLHIGHGKTGSSYLQSCFAGSRPALEDFGIAYPATEEMVAARKGTTSSGNGVILHLMLDGKGALPDGNVLFSDETLFHHLGNEPFQKAFKSFAEGRKVSVLLFIRDPVAHVCSSYLQRVKNAGYTGTLEKFIEIYGAPARVNMVLDFLESIDAEITVRNYSASDDVRPVAADWLGVNLDTLTPPDKSRVNRNLSEAEHALQLLYNRRAGAKAKILGKRLSNELPDIKPFSIRPSMEVQRALWDRFSGEIERVNARVPDAERYDMERDLSKGPSEKPQDFAFTRAQLAIIADVMAGRGEATPG